MAATKPDEKAKIDPSKLILKQDGEAAGIKAPITTVQETEEHRATEVQQDDETGPSTMDELVKLKKDRTEAHLLQLIGGTITNLVVQDHPDLGKIYGLAIKSQFSQHGDINVIAWIMADPEGNGPGHLDIVDGE